jgi:hypothetical protein
MEDRYPFIRSVTGAAEIVAGAVALVLFLGGTMAACEQGGFGGFVSFVLTLLVAGLAYGAAMVAVECLRLLLDIRERLDGVGNARRADGGGAGGDGPS